MSRYLRAATETKVRAKRIAGGESLCIESKTIGAGLAFNLQSENISKTGILLSGGNYKRVPFIVNTILEMTVDPGSNFLERPIACLGKVVRIEERPGEVARYGVQIVQMEAKDYEAWEKAVTTMDARKTKLQLYPKQVEALHFCSAFQVY